jgi:hypothetical protein
MDLMAEAPVFSSPFFSENKQLRNIPAANPESFPSSWTTPHPQAF